jgi:hypothetical protein
MTVRLITQFASTTIRGLYPASCRVYVDNRSVDAEKKRERVSWRRTRQTSCLGVNVLFGGYESNTDKKLKRFCLKVIKNDAITQHQAPS